MNELTFFDLKTLYFSELIGDTWLGIAIGCIIISFIAIKNKIPYEILIMLNILWILIIYATINGFTLLWILIVLLAGFYLYYQISKTIRRG